MKFLAMFIMSVLMGLNAAHGAFAEALGRLPVQDGGRIKPFDTLARESLQLVYGKQKYNDKDATEVVFTWLLIPEHWDEQEFVKLGYAPLKEALKLPKEKSLYSPKELMNNDRIPLLFADLQNKRSIKEKLNAFDQAVQTLESQLGVFHQFKLGNHLRLVPPRAVLQAEPPQQGDAWLPVSQLSEKLDVQFRSLAEAFVKNIKGAASPEDLSKAVDAFKSAARAENPQAYPSDTKINVEYHYNQLAPFQKAWLMYVFALIFLALEFFFKKPAFYRLAWTSIIIAFLIHAYGFALRIYIAERPPVSNMYESVIWVSFGCVVFSLIFETIYRRRYTLLAGSIVGAICLIVADLAPSILDPSLQPLEPVLRSNFWLTVHVLTITLSYAAFFLAFVLGDVGLVYFLRGEQQFAQQIKFLADSCYRAIQVGVVLLAAGTILGGVWADYSWGRFWGWDPKETWAFIALMGYLALLHARLVGWTRQLGMIAGSVGSFSLVMMAWYGVNYVLGAGLHSYGFGAGGVQYVASFVAAHLIFLTYVVYFVRAKRVNMQKV